MPQRAYKYRLYPNKTQQKLLVNYFGAGRFVSNRCLDWRSLAYKIDGESVTGIDFSRELTFLKKLDTYSWLKEVPATVLIQKLRDLDTAFKKFFKEGAGYPKHRKRHQKQSIRFQMDQRIVKNNFLAGKLLKVPGLGKLNVRWTRLPQGIPKMVTISMDKAGCYFVSMAVEEEIEALPLAGKAVGIDVGLNHLACLSNGEKIDNPKHFKKHKSQLKKLQQRLSRQVKTSNRRKKTKLRIARLHARIADCRSEHLHRLTTQIVNDNQVICIEDINAEGMGRSAKGDMDNPGKMVKQKAGLNRNLKDAAFGEIRRQLEYKASWRSRTVLKVDRFFASSKLCSTPGCDYKHPNLTLDIRNWVCPQCNAEHDRDINAAKNIEAEGLKQLTPAGILGEVRDSGGKGACLISVSPRSSVTSKACQ